MLVMTVKHIMVFAILLIQTIMMPMRIILILMVLVLIGFACVWVGEVV